MKLTFLLLMIAILNVSAHTEAQTITLSGKNITLKKVFSIIKKQTGYVVFTSQIVLSDVKPISVSVTNMLLTDFLELTLKDQPLHYKIVDKTIILTRKLLEKTPTIERVAIVIPPPPPTVDVTVVVQNIDGQPLEGASIRVKGTQRGSTTDASGHAILRGIASDAKLIISFTGFSDQEVAIGNDNTVIIKLTALSNKLDDIVIVGYGTQRKDKVSGAITTVTAKDVSLSPAPNLANGLAGRISGVVINDRGGEAGNDAISINIRGVSTNGNSSPLYVIDGIVRDYGALSFIPPADVESITVLKDASAAIYGSRAANGVILVTTKRGKTGKAIVNATYNQAWVQPERIPKYADAPTYAKMVNLENELLGLPDTYTANDITLYENGKDPLNHPNTNWPKLVLADWQMQERADVNLNGGTEGVKYYVGAGYLQDGSPFAKGFTYDKQYHFISNIDAQVNKNLKISLNLTGRVRNNVSSHMDWGNLFLSLPILNGIYPNGLVGPGRTGNNAVLMSRDMDYGYQSQNTGNFTSTASAEYKIPGLNGLALSGNFAYDYDNNYIKSWNGVTYYYVLDPTTGLYNKMQNSNAAAPSLSINFPAGSTVTSNIKLSYNHTFSKLHTVDAFVAFEQSTSSAYDLTASRSNYASGALAELFAGDANTANQSNNGSSNRTGRQNLFGRALYTYNDKYNVQFQFRYDGSDNFAPGKRWGFFPGVSGNWVISKENFIKDVSWINNLKLRASWGQMGNDNVGAYQYLTSYSYGNNYPFNSTSAQGLVQANTPNPNITWEVAKTTDIGIDWQILNGLLTATIDVFRTDRSNILAPPNASVPAYTGLSLPDENIGHIINKGIELDLSTTHKIGNFRYTVEGNFTYAKNTVISIDETPGLPSYQQQTGKSLGSALLYETDGIFKSQAQINSTPHMTGVVPGELIYRDVNHDGIINNLDMVRQSYSPMPQIVYGLNFNFAYKGFDLIVGLQGQTEAYGEKYSVLPFDPTGWGNFPAAQANNAWSPSNPNGVNPSPGQNFTNGTTNTTWRYASMAFLKLKTSEIGYTFSNQLLSKAGFKSAKVFLNGSNLIFIHDNFKDAGQNPELTNWAWGMDQLRVINLGINFTL